MVRKASYDNLDWWSCHQPNLPRNAKVLLGIQVVQVDLARVLHFLNSMSSQRDILFLNSSEFTMEDFYKFTYS